MNEIKSLYNFIGKYISLDEALKSRLADIVTIKNYPANTTFIQEGQYNRHFRYLHTGFIRFYSNHDGKDVTTWFEDSNQLLCSNDGFSFTKQTDESIETLEDCVILEISSSDFLNLLSDFPVLQRFLRKWIEDTFAMQLEFYKFIMFMSAKEKYDRLLAYVPDIELRVKAIHIASLLGISPETLSRLRAERLK